MWWAVCPTHAAPHADNPHQPFVIRAQHSFSVGVIRDKDNRPPKRYQILATFTRLQASHASQGNSAKLREQKFRWAQLNECAVVGDRVPGTDSTPLPLMCGTVCGTACADAAYRASTFRLRREADRHDNHHLRTHSHSARRQSHAAKQTDWLSTPTHAQNQPHSRLNGAPQP